MKDSPLRLLLMLVVLLSVGLAMHGRSTSAQAQAKWTPGRGPCWDKATTQWDMNQCAGADFERADRELTDILQKLERANTSDRLFLEKLKTAQQAWLAYRDAHLESLYPSANPSEYGSANRMCRSLISANLTQERTKILRETFGTYKTDVCFPNRLADGPTKP